MNKHGALTAAALLMAAATASISAAASAQDVSGKGGPVQVGGDNWHADQSTHTQFWDGRVEVQQDGARLRADHIKLIHAGGSGESGDSKSWGEVVRMEATGNVYYVTEDRTMSGDNAVYTKADDTVVITGANVILKQGQNVMTGTRLVTHPNAGTSTFDSSPDSANHGRVKAIIYPDQDANGNPKPKKPAKPAAAPAAAASSSAAH